MLHLALVLALGVQADDTLVLDGKTWRLLDGVVAQAGDAVVTRSELEQQAQRLLEASRRPDRELEPAEYEELMGVTLYQQLLAMLEAQGGEDLGLAPQDIARIVRVEQREERLQRGAGGFSDLLRQGGSDALDWEHQRGRMILRRIWRDHVLGRRGFGLERARRDEFLRPGKMLAIYRSQGEALGKPTRLRFQEVLIGIRGDDPVATLEYAELIREDVLTGRTSFDLLATQFNPPQRAEERGLTPTFTLDELADPEVRAFARQGSEGDISEPIEVWIRREGVPDPILAAYRLLKIVEYEAGEPPPPFYDAELQAFLRDRIAEVERERLLFTQQRRLFDRAYAWVRPGTPEPLPPAPPQSLTPRRAPEEPTSGS
ncbi:MAG: hypothetical protein WD226_11865 [Planctomycetota bacterium]